MNELVKKFISTKFFRENEKTQEFENNAQSFIEKLNNKKNNKNELIKELKQYSLTWDVYSVAIFFIILLKEELQIDIEKYEFMKQYVNILNKTIFSMPDARPTIKTIIEEIKTTFSSVKKNEYYHFLDSLHNDQIEQPESNV
jgi:hypothetical protein